MDQNDTQNNGEANPDNNLNDQNNMASLLENEGLGIEFPTQGEIRKGVVASITPGQILVSVGTKSEGVITGKEYELIPSDELADLKIGQEIPVFVVNPEDSSGNLILSYMRAREEEGWQVVESLLAGKQSHHSTVIGYNKGGLIVPVGGLRGFVPASQISLTRRAGVTGDTPEQRWGKMIGQELDVCVIEVDRERRRLILSERQASTETRESVKERVLDELKVGETYIGRVTSIADFGVFVNVNGADGLVHMSEISWDRVQHPSEILKVGQEIKVKVINIDHEKKRIGLSIRQLLSDPWDQKAAKFHEGQLVEGIITRLTKFGAFARLTDDIEGLIHISEISEKRIEHPKEVLKEGESYTLRVIKVDPNEHRIGLSLRRVESMAYADMDWQSLENILVEDDEEVKPADVVDESKSAEVGDESKGAEVVKESKPVKAAKEPKPVKVAKETKASKVTKAVEESKPAEAVEESKPAEAVEESKPVEAVEESKPVEAVEESKPTDTAEPPVSPEPKE